MIAGNFWRATANVFAFRVAERAILKSNILWRKLAPLRAAPRIIAAALSFGVAGVAPAADGWGQCSMTNLKVCAIGTIVRDHRHPQAVPSEVGGDSK